jgi:hypothetical protein
VFETWRDLPGPRRRGCPKRVIWFGSKII